MGAIVGILVIPDPHTGVAHGFGNLGSDSYQFDNFRHFDSAGTIADVCGRATDAWNRFYNEMRNSIQPTHPPQYDQVGIVRSNPLHAFGALTHSLQDFYAHSNWIEIHIARGLPLSTIEGLFPPPCDTRTWPSGLQTGYFDLRHGWDGCHELTPPSGFNYCHEHLNKDNNESLQGRKQVPGMAITYHDLAMQLARTHTAELYRLVVASLERDWANDFPAVRSDCLVRHVFQGSTAPCRWGQLAVRSTSSAVTIGSGTVSLVSSSGQILASYGVSSWPPGPIQTSTCLNGAVVRYDFEIVDRYPLPSPRRLQGQVTLSSGGCDATLQIHPEARIDYLVRFTNADTVLPLYTDVVAVVNGSPQTSTGPVYSGTTVWMNLGRCHAVFTYDFIFSFIDLETGDPITLVPDPPPMEALPGCQDSIRANIGGRIY
jgi:hypothetical protein